MNQDKIGLNFIRPDAGRPGNHDFVHNGEWLAAQFAELKVRWNRLAFSWVGIQPERERFDWEPYDRVVRVCQKAGIRVLATIGGHFDRPPVPAWAGGTLAEVLEKNPDDFYSFIAACVGRYGDWIKHWEMLNEPRNHHVGLTVDSYIEKILRPGYEIVKGADQSLVVLPCAFDQLPVKGDKKVFWAKGTRFADVHNLHNYQTWGLFRTDPEAVAAADERVVRRFLKAMEDHGESKKAMWLTEIGWWGSGSLGGKYEYYRKDPFTGVEYRPSYTGREILEHPTVNREDAFRAEWMKHLFPRLAAVPGCDKAFLWVSLDEFEGGFDPDQAYGKEGAKQVDLWGIFAGDKSWRTSAHTFKKILAEAGSVSGG